MNARSIRVAFLILVVLLPVLAIPAGAEGPWNRAFARKAQGVEVVGVLMDREPPGFFQTNRVAFPVVRAPGRDFLQKLKVSRAPLMVRVARGGRVEDVALGYTDPIRVGEIFRP